ncbi:MAG: alpha/beta fold hydrolase [Anaerosomatales bacterium]|nr:alpha/beta fold hydrolase [Anaerosomatales bacterium]MDT8433867.1 alpha/beta fold hydrolase [Anaerosomatales bacterium]
MVPANTSGSTETRPHRLRYVVGAASILLLLAAATFLIWALTPYRANEAALEAMGSGGGITVTEGREGIVFMPPATPDAGLVLYPGGRVEARAYAPLARMIADEGFLVVIQPMPLNLAVFGIGRAQRALDAFPEVDSWAVGGHSLGGSMAAEFVARNPDHVDGLVLLASYPAPSTDLTDSGFGVISVWGTNDGLVTEEDVEDSRLRLPPSAKMIVIDGGNHAGFGAYGAQAGDGGSPLADGAQASLTAQAVAELLARISE